MCLPSTVAASWSLMQEIAGLSPKTTLMTNIFVIEFSKFNEKI